ncbi:putative nucleotidyltransferase [Catalinimonas alkaloidigena]|uniref:nucleotidyltransferase family protein n=1 Tax=Catalinimonas alkaloidigena TaxID=1075417 RepID=UPI002405A800|nr:nucleotidyltransferase domain-containing protein [Catalinimonas alkaloidigena]MDF9795816.1 putative nucleotidyltransferase [Catalinimonas alkaloidigena]
MIRIIEENIEALNSICKLNKVSELYLFGSATTGEFTDKSDLDFAVLFFESLSPLEHGDAFFSLKEDLENLFGREIDLLSYRVVKNPIFKEELDKTKVVLYAA